MDIRRQDQDDEIIRLLGKLNEQAPEYPSGMFSKRRAAVMAAFAALNLGAATAGLGLIAHLVKIIKAMGVVEKIVLGVEVAAVTGMTAYGAVTAYVYRNEIRQVLESNLGITTNTPFPSLTVPGGGGGAATEITGLGTPTWTPSPSPTPTGTFYTTVPTQPGGGPGPVATSTPPPVAHATSTTKPGNSYGLTKTPKPPQSTKTP